MSGVELIAAERERQIEEEGWTAKHDDATCQIGDLSTAGALYALDAHVLPLAAPRPRDEWPFAQEWWKPSSSPLRNLAKAGALIAAEMDRLMRIEEDKE